MTFRTTVAPPVDWRRTRPQTRNLHRIWWPYWLFWVCLDSVRAIGSPIWVKSIYQIGFVVAKQNCSSVHKYLCIAETTRYDPKCCVDSKSTFRFGIAHRNYELETRTDQQSSSQVGFPSHPTKPNLHSDCHQILIVGTRSWIDVLFYQTSDFSHGHVVTYSILNMISVSTKNFGPYRVTLGMVECFARRYEVAWIWVLRCRINSYLVVRFNHSQASTSCFDPSWADSGLPTQIQQNSGLPTQTWTQLGHTCMRDFAEVVN